jgi:hypothetical protein
VVHWRASAEPQGAPTVEGYGKNDIRKTLIEQGSQKSKSQLSGEDMIVIVKPSDKSDYKNMVDYYGRNAALRAIHSERCYS